MIIRGDQSFNITYCHSSDNKNPALFLYVPDSDLSRHFFIFAPFMNKPNFLFWLTFVFSGLTWQELVAQTKNNPGLGLDIVKAKGAINLDGKLDEEDWKSASIAKDFFLNYPVDTAMAPFQTEARVTFDEHNLYASFVCYDDQTPNVVQSLRRDFVFDTNDNVTLILGPFNDGINGFYFSVTPQGVQLEGTINSGGADDEGSYSSTWDNKWYSKVVKYSDRWVAEIAIPFKSFRFKGGANEWNITFLRYDLKRNTTSSWIATPIQFIPASFAYAGKLLWKDNPPNAHTNISVIPYVAGSSLQDKEVDPQTSDQALQVGFDAKVAVTPSLNLDLTVNPDFSQVEVDNQVINLTRFEFQFPERRQFFLENSDLFERAGFPGARSFFSRRIGLARDSSGNLQKVPILFGARLSGSINKKWRMGAMNMQTKEKLSLGLPGQNYTVASLQRNFWKQSNISFIYVDKESLRVGEGDSLKYFNSSLWKEKVSGADTTTVLNRFNRIIGFDSEMRSADNRWYASTYYSRSFDNFNTSKRNTGGGFLQYTKRNYQFFAGYTNVQRNYNAEVGFVPSYRVYPGIGNYFVSGSGTIYPKNSKIVNMQPGIDVMISSIPDGTITDKSTNFSYNFSFLNTSAIQASYMITYQQLTNGFSLIDDVKYTSFQQGEIYSWGTYVLNYQSDQRKRLTYSLEGRTGGFYNGSNFNLNGDIRYRVQPYGSMSVKFDYNDLRLPENYGKEKLVLIQPRFDITFTDKLFLTTFIQYNTYRQNNILLNTRLQWRYKPASDFFLVYTENYLPEHLKTKNRALVFKFTYWLNL
jgi:hypothetical protein